MVLFDMMIEQLAGRASGFAPHATPKNRIL